MTILCKILKEEDFYGKILEKNIKKIYIILLNG